MLRRQSYCHIDGLSGMAQTIFLPAALPYMRVGTVGLDNISREEQECAHGSDTRADLRPH